MARTGRKPGSSPDPLSHRCGTTPRTADAAPPAQRASDGQTACRTRFALIFNRPPPRPAALRPRRGNPRALDHAALRRHHATPADAGTTATRTSSTLPLRRSPCRRTTPHAAFTAPTARGLRRPARSLSCLATASLSPQTLRLPILHPASAAHARGSVLIVVLVVCLGLVSITLVLGHSMLMAYRGADNEIAGRQAEPPSRARRATPNAHGQRRQRRRRARPDHVPERRRARRADAFWFIGEPPYGATAGLGRATGHEHRRQRPTHVWTGGRGFQAQPQPRHLRHAPPTCPA